MAEWLDFIIGELQVSDDIKVIVALIGAMFFMEIISLCFAFLGGVKR